MSRASDSKPNDSIEAVLKKREDEMLAIEDTHSVMRSIRSVSQRGAICSGHTLGYQIR